MSFQSDKEHIRELTYRCGCCAETFRVRDVKLCPFCGCSHLQKLSAEEFETFFSANFTTSKADDTNT